jgi:hypothetical protein
MAFVAIYAAGIPLVSHTYGSKYQPMDALSVQHPVFPSAEHERGHIVVFFRNEIRPPHRVRNQHFDHPLLLFSDKNHLQQKITRYR